MFVIQSPVMLRDHLSVQLRGPVAHGTVAEPVKFHDDKSTYTGVHKKGGPSTNDHRINLSNLLGVSFLPNHFTKCKILRPDRSEANARGVKLMYARKDQKVENASQQKQRGQSSQRNAPLVRIEAKLRETKLSSKGNRLVTCAKLCIVVTVILSAKKTKFLVQLPDQMLRLADSV